MQEYLDFSHPFPVDMVREYPENSVNSRIYYYSLCGKNY